MPLLPHSSRYISRRLAAGGGRGVLRGGRAFGQLQVAVEQLLTE